MSLPEGLEKLLKAAYAAGAAGETSAKTALEKTLERIESMDSTQSGVYGQAATDFLTHVRNSLGRCPRCGHAPHGSWCANMASDNDCNCTYDPAAEWVDTIEMGDRLSAIAGLDDATSRDLPSLQVGTTVDFREGSFVVQAYTRHMDAAAQVELVDKSAYLADRTITTPVPDPTHGRIDKDIQTYVERMKPSSLGQRVAMETTLQDKRDREERERKTGYAEEEVYAFEKCHECGGKVDDKDIAKLGRRRFGHTLCVYDYVTYAQHHVDGGRESWEG